MQNRNKKVTKYSLSSLSLYPYSIKEDFVMVYHVIKVFICYEKCPTSLKIDIDCMLVVIVEKLEDTIISDLYMRE